MARKSRFRAPVQEKPKLRVYSTGAYVRLSVLDGHQCDSDSIENQEALVRAYVESDPSLSLFSVYSDNGETGWILNGMILNACLMIYGRARWIASSSKTFPVLDGIT